MFTYVRAAAFAAAAIGAALSPSFADPTLAYEIEAAPTPTYIDHATALTADVEVEADTAGAEKILSHDVHFSTTVAEHAVAKLTDEPQRDEEKAPLLSLAALVDEHQSAQTSDSELECLAGAIYFESKGEPLAGQLAVAEVVINRTKSGRYPTTVCGVVKQPSQFSFVRGGRIPAANRESPAWRKAVAIAHIAINDLADSPASRALSFHATRVSPGWNMKRIARVGNHIFYR